MIIMTGQDWIWTSWDRGFGLFATAETFRLPEIVLDIPFLFCKFDDPDQDNYGDNNGQPKLER